VLNQAFYFKSSHLLPSISKRLHLWEAWPAKDDARFLQSQATLETICCSVATTLEYWTRE